VDVLVRPQGLALATARDGQAIVVGRTFLGAVTRVSVLISGETGVRVDVPSAEAAGVTPGAAAAVSLPAAPVLVAPRRTASDAPVPVG
jgi:putative spermidine/putrescine transport system ATP-binding protein